MMIMMLGTTSHADSLPQALGLHRLLTVCIRCKLCRPHATYVNVGSDTGQRALKYFASGWCTIIASVDCSGCS